MRSAAAGFTLLEMLAVLLILGVVTASAVPASSAIYGSFNKRDAEVQALEDMRRAQATAVEQGCRGILTFSDNHRGYTFGCDYVPYNEDEEPVWDTALFTRSLPSKVSMYSDDLLIFNTRGQSVTTVGDLDTRVITLKINEDGSEQSFATGILRPTGFFSFD